MPRALLLIGEAGTGVPAAATRVLERFRAAGEPVVHVLRESAFADAADGELVVD